MRTKNHRDFAYHRDPLEDFRWVQLQIGWMLICLQYCRVRARS
jgi:hypothetical protein